MCGIVAAIAETNIVPTLIEGLNKLEYRGYDSAGIAIVNQDGVERYRALGRVSELEKKTQDLKATAGIAHTRWATHGVPSKRNAHPHVSGGVAVVHNGIIENYESLREELIAQGYVFESETDTETIAHLIELILKTESSLFEAVRQTTQKLVGAYAIAVIEESHPELIVVAREGSPLLLGVSESGIYAASDASALLQVTQQLIYLENGDIAQLKNNQFCITDQAGTPVAREIVVSQLSADAVDLGNYQHYMQKEIFEQPDALANTIEIVASSDQIHTQLFGAQAPQIFKEIDRILILACGTSNYAGQVAKYWLESIAKVPTSVEVASEYRYRTTVPNPRQLVVAISQSGETADTLAALRFAKSLGQEKTFAICNVPESAIVRECELRFITRAGPEIGVASTKAFTTQLAALFMLTLAVAKQRGVLFPAEEGQYLHELRHLPAAVIEVLKLENSIKVWAEKFSSKQDAIFLGRGRHYPIALEGALKLKEISYIHAEAYPAGELKHGPLALIDSEMPVVAIAPNDELLEKLKSNLQEVKARGGELFVFADQGSHITQSDEIHILYLPEHYGELSPILHTVALQLFAYHCALMKGNDVDKPRNLAKSVTVE
ncbi:glutamine--fructose-6-phosphate transaminase (isomerizing) [Polynucleobacter sp. 71A-WALBACH]|uniref:glutamine--fructose-6-phosphate transaminase (isomerizing) n=1 Tax=Polynucleobacter sp. 71A-WALBACH TaxID=2689097 RepID=UPI001C0C26AE|nr:glutamine--fructose-6-phosphate transaminase (isomerizing) [Polynucleobacter sp. 71A-WALBACH]MBU3593270.1 glutamine--fructose-6-phosphate transaminase (isomerizing) [Polynucleobacter sp. 71A-WALBACH]